MQLLPSILTLRRTALRTSISGEPSRARAQCTVIQSAAIDMQKTGIVARELGGEVVVRCAV